MTSVLEVVLASIALPPWFAPIEKEGHCMVDGGALGNLPIEPAMQLDPTAINALDLHAFNVTSDATGMLELFLTKLAPIGSVLANTLIRQVTRARD